MKKSVWVLMVIKMLLGLYFMICWVVNIIQLSNCDFEPSYKDEVIKLVGLIGPVSGITVWL